MRVAVGADHAGFEEPPPHFKPEIIKHLKARGHQVIDCGTFGPDPVDYPDFAGKVCEAIQKGEADRGVLMCGSGIGVGIAANRFKNIRAATCATPEMARLARDHNNANVLCMGRRILSLEECLRLIDIWLDTPFSGRDRHKRCVEKLE